MVGRKKGDLQVDVVWGPESIKEKSLMQVPDIRDSRFTPGPG